MPLEVYLVVTVPSWGRGCERCIFCWDISLLFYHTWAPVSQRSVSCFLPSVGWNGGFLVTSMKFGHAKWNISVAANCPAFCPRYGWYLGAQVWFVHSYAFCKEPMPGSGESEPTDSGSGVTMWGHTPPSALCKLQSSLGTQMPLQGSDQHFPPQNSRVCNGLLILFSALFW